MALQCNYLFKGITIPNAYIRLDKVSGSKNEDPFANTGSDSPSPPIWLANIEISTASNRLHIVTSTVYTLPLIDYDVNCFQNFYNYLKTLPEFEGAIDV